MAAFGKSLSFSGGSSGTTALGGGTTGGSLFGGFNQTSNPTGGSLFGGASAANDKRQRSGTATDATPAFGQAAGGGGLFGSGAQASTTAAAGGSTGGGLFGSAQTGGTGLFGSAPSNAGAANTTSTGLFGSGSGLFGGGAAASQPAQPAQPSGLFGGGAGFQQQMPAATLQQQQAQVPPQQQQQQQQPSEAEELGKQLLLIKDCWDPASPNYQFRHYFYNVSEPGQAHLYQCPAGQDPALWQQAQSDNPDPQSLVPVLANGFEDLRKRVDSQSLQMQSYQERTEEVTQKLCDILQKHHSGTTVRLSECRRRQAELSQRLLEFMKLLQLLRLRGQLLNPDEETFRVRVEHLEKDMSRSGALKQRLAELQDHTYRLQASARRRRELNGLAGGSAGGDGYEVADEAQLQSVMKMLSEKQRGLAHLTQVVSQNAQAIDAIEGAIEERYVEVQKQQEVRERAQVSKSLSRLW